MRELGIIPWRFYEAKSKYTKDKNNELLAIGNKGNFIPCPDFTKKCSHVKKASDERICSNINIELQSANGTIMRIHGELNNSQLESIILSATNHV